MKSKIMSYHEAFGHTPGSFFSPNDSNYGIPTDLTFLVCVLGLVLTLVLLVTYIYECIRTTVVLHHNQLNLVYYFYRLCELPFYLCTGQRWFYDTRANFNRNNLTLTSTEVFDRNGTVKLRGFCQRCRLYGHTGDCFHIKVSAYSRFLSSLYNVYLPDVPRGIHNEQVINCNFTYQDLCFNQKDRNAFWKKLETLNNDYLGPENYYYRTPIPSEIAFVPANTIPILMPMSIVAPNARINQYPSLPHAAFVEYDDLDHLIDRLRFFSNKITRVTIYATDDVHLENISEASKYFNHFALVSTDPAYNFAEAADDYIYDDAKKHYANIVNPIQPQPLNQFQLPEQPRVPLPNVLPDGIAPPFLRDDPRPIRGQRPRNFLQNLLIYSLLIVTVTGNCPPSVYLTKPNENIYYLENEPTQRNILDLWIEYDQEINLANFIQLNTDAVFQTPIGPVEFTHNEDLPRLYAYQEACKTEPTPSEISTELNNDQEMTKYVMLLIKALQTKPIRSPVLPERPYETISCGKLTCYRYHKKCVTIMTKYCKKLHTGQKVFPTLFNREPTRNYLVNFIGTQSELFNYLENFDIQHRTLVNSTNHITNDTLYIQQTELLTEQDIRILFDKADYYGADNSNLIVLRSQNESQLMNHLKPYTNEDTYEAFEVRFNTFVINYYVNLPEVIPDQTLPSNGKIRGAVNYTVEFCQKLEHPDTLPLYYECLKQRPLNLTVYHPNYDYINVRVDVTASQFFLSEENLHHLRGSIAYEYQNKQYIFHRPLFYQPGEYSTQVLGDGFRFCKRDDTFPFSASPTTVCQNMYVPNIAINTVLNNLFISPRFVTIFLAILCFCTYFFAYTQVYLHPGFTIARIFTTLGIYVYNQLPVNIFAWFINYLGYTFIGTFQFWYSLTILGLNYYFIIGYASLAKKLFLTCEMLFHFWCLYEELQNNCELLLIFTCSVAIYRYYFGRPLYDQPWITNEQASVVVDNLARKYKLTKQALQQKFMSDLSRSDTSDIELLREKWFYIQCHRQLNNTTTTGFSPLELPIATRPNIESTPVPIAEATTKYSDLQFKMPDVPTQHAPTLQYTDLKGESRQLRGSLRTINGKACVHIQRHLFGGDYKKPEWKNFRILIDNIPIEYSNPQPYNHNWIIECPELPTFESNYHPNPLEYQGPIFLIDKTSNNSRAGYADKGRHNISTAFGDCGLGLYDADGRHLGDHIGTTFTECSQQPWNDRNIYVFNYFEAHNGAIVEHMKNFDINPVPIKETRPILRPQTTVENLRLFSKINPQRTTNYHPILENFGLSRETATGIDGKFVSENLSLLDTLQYNDGVTVKAAIIHDIRGRPETSTLQNVSLKVKLESLAIYPLPVDQFLYAIFNALEYAGLYVPVAFICNLVLGFKTRNWFRTLLYFALLSYASYLHFNYAYAPCEPGYATTYTSCKAWHQGEVPVPIDISKVQYAVNFNCLKIGARGSCAGNLYRGDPSTPGVSGQYVQCDYVCGIVPTYYSAMIVLGLRLLSLILIFWSTYRYFYPARPVCKIIAEATETNYLNRLKALQTGLQTLVSYPYYAKLTPYLQILRDSIENPNSNYKAVYDDVSYRLQVAEPVFTLITYVKDPEERHNIIRCALHTDYAVDEQIVRQLVSNFADLPNHIIPGTENLTDPAMSLLLVRNLTVADLRAFIDKLKLQIKRIDPKLLAERYEDLVSTLEHYRNQYEESQEKKERSLSRDIFAILNTLKRQHNRYQNDLLQTIQKERKLEEKEARRVQEEFMKQQREIREADCIAYAINSMVTAFCMNKVSNEVREVLFANLDKLYEDKERLTASEQTQADFINEQKPLIEAASSRAALQAIFTSNNFTTAFSPCGELFRCYDSHNGQGHSLSRCHRVLESMYNDHVVDCVNRRGPCYKAVLSHKHPNCNQRERCMPYYERVQAIVNSCDSCRICAICPIGNKDASCTTGDYHPHVKLPKSEMWVNAAKRFEKEQLDVSINEADGRTVWLLKLRGTPIAYATSTEEPAQSSFIAFPKYYNDTHFYYVKKVFNNLDTLVQIKRILRDLIHGAQTESSELSTYFLPPVTEEPQPTPAPSKPTLSLESLLKPPQVKLPASEHTKPNEPQPSTSTHGLDAILTQLEGVILGGLDGEKYVMGKSLLDQLRQQNQLAGN